MHIIRLDDDTIATGRLVFQGHVARSACGPGSHAYEFYREREFGPQAIPGAILECITLGLTNEDDILFAVSRATHCRASTVETFLHCLAGDDPRLHLWRVEAGLYRDLGAAAGSYEERPQLLLAA